MRKINTKLSVLMVFALFMIGVMSISYAAAQPSTTISYDANRTISRSTQVTDTFNGYVSRYETDWYAIDAAPGLMSVSVSWSNSYDIDCYISTTQSTSTYLARGYTTNNPETCSYTIQSAGTYYVGVKMYTRWSSNTAYTLTVTYYEEGATPDTENPVVDITSPTNGATVSGTISIDATATDNVGVDYARCNIDGGSWTTDSTSPYSWSLDTTTLSDGSHTINVGAYDAAGNYGSDSVSITVANGGGSDPIQIHEDLSGYVAGYEIDYFELNAEPGLMSVSVSWSGSYDIDCYICETADYTSYLARGYTTSNPETCSYTIQTSGTYYVGVRMYTSSAPSTAYNLDVDYYVLPNGDYVDPTVSLTSPANGATIVGTTTVTATASDDVAVDYVAFSVDGGSWTNDYSSPYSWSWDSTTVGDGSHTLTVRAYDTSGNYADDSVSVTVDNVQGTAGKYALICGVSDYKAISDLSYCDEDATDWYYYLVNVCGYESQNVIVLGDGHTSNFPKYDGYATEANTKYYLNWLAQQEGEITYITSGHGSGNGAGSSYVCSWDCGSGEDGEDGDLYDTEVAAILGNAVADQIFIFIDHCYSGGFGPEFMAMNSGSKTYCTTTCTEDGYGYDDSQHQNGAWTYYFLDYTLINHYGSNPSTYMEDAFDYASAAYPHSGGDAAMEFDGNSGSYFTLG